MDTSLLVIYNPVCGDGSAKPFFEKIILPFLDKHRKVPNMTVMTEEPGHAGSAVLNFLESTGSGIQSLSLGPAMALFTK